LKLKSLSFVSAVDVPAQETATAAIIKRAGDAIEFEARCTVAKVDSELGIVLGWALTSTVDGEPYFDLQGDAIDESNLVKVAADYMESGGYSDEMHDGEEDGRVVFCWPMTEEIASALDIQTAKTGLLVGIKPSPDVLEKFKSHEYTGFSIAGYGERQAVKARTAKCMKCSSYMAKDALKCPSCGAAAPKKRAVSKATWSTAYMDDLPDSAFLYVEGGGSKDSSGKTTPRSLRHFPYKDVNGKVDIAHLRDAIGRIPQSSLSASLKEKLQQRAEKLLASQHADGKRFEAATKQADCDRVAVAKHAYLTTETLGHTHLLDHNNGQAAGYTDYAYVAGTGEYHCHPWTRNSDLDTFVVGASAGHDHQVITQDQVDQLVDAGAATADLDLPSASMDPEVGTGLPNQDANKRAQFSKGNAMKEPATETADLKKKLEKRDAEIARLEKKYAMSDAQRAYYKSLEKREAKDEFLEKSSADRDADVAKSLEANPVVIEVDGVQYRKNDDPRMIAMAKRSKEQAEIIAKRESELADERLEKRVKIELANLPGEMPAKKALLRIVDDIADVELKKGVTAIVAAGNNALAKAFATLGHGARTSEGSPDGVQPQAQLDALVKQHADKNHVDPTVAYGEVLKSAEGKRLYAQVELAKRAGN
jgi:hypothetical protein